MPLPSVTGIEIETIQRIRGKHGNSMRALTSDELARGVAAVACHNLVLVRNDGLRIHVVETTDRSVLEEIQAILNKETSQKGASFRDTIGDASDKG